MPIYFITEKRLFQNKTVTFNGYGIKFILIVWDSNDKYCAKKYIKNSFTYE